MLWHWESQTLCVQLSQLQLEVFSIWINDNSLFIEPLLSLTESVAPPLEIECAIVSLAHDIYSYLKAYLRLPLKVQKQINKVIAVLRTEDAKNLTF